MWTYAVLLCAICKWSLQSWSNSILTSSKGNIFRVTGTLWRESTGHRWTPPPPPPPTHTHTHTHTMASDAELCFFFICGSANNRYAGELRRRWAHCDVTLTEDFSLCSICWLSQNNWFVIIGNPINLCLNYWNALRSDTTFIKTIAKQNLFFQNQFHRHAFYIGCTFWVNDIFCFILLETTTSMTKVIWIISTY